MKPAQAEIARLKRKVVQVKAERDILKRTRPTSRRYRPEVLLHCEAPGDVAGGWLCGALGVSRGGVSAWLTRPRSRRSQSDKELSAKARGSLLGSDRTYIYIIDAHS
jgi:hypothetical protein